MTTLSDFGPDLPNPASFTPDGKFEAQLFRGKTQDSFFSMPDSRREVIFARCKPFNLSAIMVRDDLKIDEFIHSNPWARRTVVTEFHPAGPLFWFWCKKQRMINSLTPSLAFCADGWAPVCWDGADLDDWLCSLGMIVEITPDELKFLEPEHKLMHQVLQLERSYGPLIRSHGKSINSALICKAVIEDMGLSFDEAADQFCKKSSSGEPEALSREALFTLLCGWMNQLAAVSGPGFPLAELRPVKLKLLMADLKVVAKLTARH